MISSTWPNLSLGADLGILKVEGMARGLCQWIFCDMKEDFMKTNPAQTNKVLFAVLLSALAVDMASRMEFGAPLRSSNLASVKPSDTTKSVRSEDIPSQISVAQICEPRIKANISNLGNAVCGVTQGEVGTTVSFKTEEVLIEHEETIPAPASGKAKKAGKTANEKKASAAKAPATPTTRIVQTKETSVKMIVTSKIGGCDLCSAKTDTIALDKDTVANPKKISERVDELQKAHVTDLRSEKDRLVKEQKEREALRKDVENCLKREDSTKISKTKDFTEYMECLADKAGSTDDEKKQKTLESRIKSELSKMIMGGNKEQLDEALALAESLSGTGNFSDGTDRSLKLMVKAGGYQAQILELTNTLNSLPANASAAKINVLGRLDMLNRRMEYDLSMYGMKDRMHENSNCLSKGKCDYSFSAEIENWQASLSSLVTQAVTNPQGALNGHGLYGRASYDGVMDLAGREARRGRATLLTSQSGFNGILSSNDRLIQDQINAAINRIGTSQVVGVGRVDPNAGLQSNGLNGINGQRITPLANRNQQGQVPQNFSPNVTGVQPIGLQQRGIPQAGTAVQ